jgi:hypothetical protein
LANLHEARCVRSGSRDRHDQRWSWVRSALGEVVARISKEQGPCVEGLCCCKILLDCARDPKSVGVSKLKTHSLLLFRVLGGYHFDRVTASISLRGSFAFELADWTLQALIGLAFLHDSASPVLSNVDLH